MIPFDHRGELPESEEKPLSFNVFSSGEFAELQAYWARRLEQLLRAIAVPELTEQRRLVLIGQVQECKRNLNLFQVMYGYGEDEKSPA